MKKCLWCKKDENEGITFDTLAHTIPKSLGGEDINPNVCDECNSYFGSKRSNEIVAIEEILKETFNLSRLRFQQPNIFKEPKKNRGRFKSRYFNIKNKNGKTKLKIKPSFKLKPHFQKELCRYFKRGLYKLYLEELNRQEGIGYENQYDFIREFSRYNLGDYPVIYFERTIGVILISNEELDTPKLIFDRMKYLVSDYGFVEIEFLSHVFGFPNRRIYEIGMSNYLKKSQIEKMGFPFKSGKEVKFLTDIDLALRIMDK